MPYDTQAFDDLLLQYVAMVRRQLIRTRPILTDGKVVGFAPLILPNID